MQQLLKQIICCAVGFGVFVNVPAQIEVVNMIPQILSHEAFPDPEPNLAVNPAHPLRMAASAFTRTVSRLKYSPDCAQCSPSDCGPYVPPCDFFSCLYPRCSPIYTSIDGGKTWELRSIIPGNLAEHPTFDITLRFAGRSNQLYGSILRGDISPEHPRLNILQIPDFLSYDRASIVMEDVDRDQPYIEAANVMAGPDRNKDRVYVGTNDWGANQIKANIDFSLDATAMAPIYSAELIEDLPQKNSSAVRSAVHLSGTIYAMFYRIASVAGTQVTGDVVVVRDDRWGADAFQKLPGGGVGTGSVVNQSPITFTVRDGISEPVLGNNRLCGSNLSIAVDPTNAATVYVAWADNGTTNINTLHVRKSSDFGVTWSAADILTIPSATNPALAINTNGRVAFVYQEYVDRPSARWVTHLRRVPVSGGASWTDDILCNSPLIPEAPPGFLYLGDYIHLMAVGKDFYGVFCASNFPDMDNFPQRVTYQRNVDFEGHFLWNTDVSDRVDPSIDPFFFHVTELASNEDFYVRDFTNSASDYDEGLEPSIEPRFCSTSDIWNQRIDVDPALNSVNPPPVGDDPQQVPAGNFAFVRVFRKQTGAAKDVKLNFFFSEYGIGNNYLQAGVPDVPLSFGAADDFKVLTSGHSWSLPAHNSSHNCLAVQISTLEDPCSPSLVGGSPGWGGIGTDQQVFNDNNTAQRNMGLFIQPAMQPMPPPVGSDINMMEMRAAAMYALVHNPGFDVSDIRLKADINRAARISAAVTVIGKEEKRYRVQDNNVITLKAMNPGETRFLKIQYVPSQAKEGEHFPVTFNHIRNDVVVNAFTLVQEHASMEKVIANNLRFDAQVFGRIQSLYKEMDTAAMIKSNDIEIQGKINKPGEYAEYLKRNSPLLRAAIKGIIDIKKQDVFKLMDAFNRLQQRLKANQLSNAAIAHLSLLNSLDACVTYLELQKGNTADILQTMILQQKVLEEINKKTDSSVKKQLISSTAGFIEQYRSRSLLSDQYPERVKELLPALKDCVKQAGKNDSRLQRSLEELEKISDPATFQGEHIKFLLSLRQASVKKK